MTAATGVNWRQFRDIMRQQYTDLVVISGRFSADTSIREIIVSARKMCKGEKPSGRGLFVTLDATPDSTLEGVCVGTSIRDTHAVNLEGRPHGGTRIKVGEDEVGTAIDCPIDTDWSVVGTDNFALHQIAYRLRQGELYLPRMISPLNLRTGPLRDIATVGPSHLQIRGGDSQPGRSTSYSGPFNVLGYRAGCLYPALWNNSREAQRQITVFPDSSLEPRRDCDDEQVAKVWGTASHIHMNIETRTTSQSLMMAYTKNRVVGGTAWPSIITDTKYQKGLAVWCNSTLGILCRWSISNHEQHGRSRSSRTAILDLPVLEPSSLMLLDGVFDEFSQRRFDRIMNLWEDPVRIALDDMMLKRLGLDGVNLDGVRRQLCAEPSINGDSASSELAAALDEGW